MSAEREPLVAALEKHVVAYRAAGEQVRSFIAEHYDHPDYVAASDAIVKLDREAVELVRVLRRIVASGALSRRALHDAFGAPGDWGYETPLGDALARVYGVRT